MPAQTPRQRTRADSARQCDKLPPGVHVGMGIGTGNACFLRTAGWRARPQSPAVRRSAQWLAVWLACAPGHCRGTCMGWTDTGTRRACRKRAG